MATLERPTTHVPHRQRGIATILLILFMGLALAAGIYGVVRSANGAQQRVLAAHAATPAQATAWVGAEGLRRFLDQVEKETVEAWRDHSPAPSADHPIALTLGGTGAAGLQAEVTGVVKLNPDPADGEHRVTVRVTGTSGTGAVRATAPLEVVYDLTLSDPPTPPPPTPPAEVPALRFFRDLNIHGHVTMEGDVNRAVAVEGNVTITDVRLEGLSLVGATGDVVVNSAVGLEKIHSNGDVSLTQGSQSEVVWARGEVLLSGGGDHGDIRANGSVRFESTEAFKVETKGQLITGRLGEPGEDRSCTDPPSPNYDGTAIRIARVEQEVLWYSCGGGVEDLLGNSTLRYHGAHRMGVHDGFADIKQTQRIRTHGDMDIRSAEHTNWMVTLGNLVHETGAHPAARYCARGNIDIPYRHEDHGPPTVPWKVEGFYGGTYWYGDSAYNTLDILPIVANSDCASWLEALEDETVAVEEVPTYTVERPRIDANALEPAANYVFRRHENGLDTVVTVRNVNGIAAGEYFLAYHQPGANWYPKFPNYLCTSRWYYPNATGRPRMPSGQGHCAVDTALRIEGIELKRICEGQNECFDYNTSTRTWVIDGANQSLVRGVVWFEGSLLLGADGYVNTWIATENITTGLGLGNGGGDAPHRTRSPNHAGYALLCANAPMPKYDGQTFETPLLAGLYPTNLCNTATQAIIENSIGNVAYVAGSYDANGEFVGGNIDLGRGGTKVGGSVLAGNELMTGQFVEINGHVVGAAQGESTGNASGHFANRVTIDPVPSGPFDPGNQPCMGACGGPVPSNNARVLWARYR